MDEIQDEFEPPIDELLQEEESNQVDTVPIYEEINQQLNRILTGTTNIII